MKPRSSLLVSKWATHKFSTTIKPHYVISSGAKKTRSDPKTSKQIRCSSVKPRRSVKTRRHEHRPHVYRPHHRVQPLHREKHVNVSNFQIFIRIQRIKSLPDLKRSRVHQKQIRTLKHYFRSFGGFVRSPNFTGGEYNLYAPPKFLPTGPANVQVM